MTPPPAGRANRRRHSAGQTPRQINPEAQSRPAFRCRFPTGNQRHGSRPRGTCAAYTIHFAYDSAVIRDSEQANLQSVAPALTADPNTKLLVEGNCDERGTEEYNRSLGERRALAAREALAKLGVDPMRVFTRSYGKDKPVDPGHDEAAWSKNRRDDFVLLHPKPGIHRQPRTARNLNPLKKAAFARPFFLGLY